MNKPLLLDLFCKAGGAGMGYHLAGFEVVGVDIEPQPHYPFRFIQADALTFPLDGYDAYHASPPCQGFVHFKYINRLIGREKEHLNLIGVMRKKLMETGKPWIIENVQMAASEMLCPVMICGTPLGLYVRRHRLFDSSEMLFSPGHCRHRRGDLGIYGGSVTRLGTRRGEFKTGKGDMHVLPEFSNKATAIDAMGIDWMTLDEMCEAIPPRYTEFLGRQIILTLPNERSAAA